MFHILAIIAAVATWFATSNLVLAIGVLVVGWLVGSMLGRVLTWVFYLVLLATGGLYLYAHQTGQPFMSLVRQLLP